jgi:hypothetical protein
MGGLANIVSGLTRKFFPRIVLFCMGVKLGPLPERNEHNRGCLGEALKIKFIRKNEAEAA